MSAGPQQRNQPQRLAAASADRVWSPRTTRLGVHIKLLPGCVYFLSFSLSHRVTRIIRLNL